MSEPPVPEAAAPAATLIVFRERQHGAPALLMVERARAMAFAAGAMVFPGGRIDPGDRLLATTMGETGGETAAKIAAIRETIEEAGLPVGFAATPCAAVVARMRAALHAGAPFGAVLADSGATLRLDRLVPFARWCPAHRLARRFDTRFFLARLPDGAPAAAVDDIENVRLVWTGARAMLDEADAGRASIIYPTRRNLERLARFASFDDAVAEARHIPPRTITPWIETRDGVDHLCIPDHLGYPVTAQPVDSALRG